MTPPELLEYLYPDDPPDENLVLQYQQSELNFYRGFRLPSVLERAQIYRAVYECVSKTFLFITPSGIIIKTDQPDLELDLSRPVFVPPGYDLLEKYTYLYACRLLNRFIADEAIPGKALLVGKTFLFIALDCDMDCTLSWSQYIAGGVSRTVKFPPDKLWTFLEIFPWSCRETAEVIEKEIKFSVKLDLLRLRTSLEALERGRSVDLKYIEIGEILENEEAFGIIRSTSSVVIPLVGTSRVYYLSSQDPPVFTDPPSVDEEGHETFTLEKFSEMSKFRKASLIRAPSGHFYSLLHLSNQTVDPLTRDRFPESFLETIKQEISKCQGPFLTGYPPTKVTPQLEIKEHNSEIKFYIALTETSLFWTIPDLRNTDYELFTIHAIQLIMQKWADRSLFGSFRGSDDNLIFSPMAFHVFTKTPPVGNGLKLRSNSELCSHSLERARWLYRKLEILQLI